MQLVHLWTILPYPDKRNQLLKMKFLRNEHNVSVMYIDINAISLWFDLNIFQQDECFCSPLGLEVEHAKTNLKHQTQIWILCHLLPFVRVGQNGQWTNLLSVDEWPSWQQLHQKLIYVFATMFIGYRNQFDMNIHYMCIEDISFELIVVILSEIIFKPYANSLCS